MRSWAAVCLLLAAAGAASAQSVHLTRVPGATGIEAPAVVRSGWWEVSVSFDAERCEIACVYRLRRDRLGRAPAYDLLPPPAVEIRVQYGPRSETVTVDPAHTQAPTAAADDDCVAVIAGLPAVRPARRPSVAVAGTASVERPRVAAASPARRVCSTLRI